MPTDKKRLPAVLLPGASGLVQQLLEMAAVPRSAPLKGPMASTKQRGFSLLELMITISISLIIGGITFMAMQPLLLQNHVNYGLRANVDGHAQHSKPGDHSRSPVLRQFLPSSW